MTEEIKTTEEVMPTQETTSEQAIAPVVPVAQVSEATVATGNVAVAQEKVDYGAPRGGRGGKPGQKGGARGGRPRAPREKPEFDSKTISIRRVTRVVSGGRRFSLSVALVAGDRNGRIGLGTGKAMDTQVAIEKAMKAAKKNMIQLRLSKNKSLIHDVNAKFKSSEVMIMPNKGRGLIAGSSARSILSLAGLNDVTAKFYSGTKNKLNNARATMKALESIAYRHDEAPVAATKVPEATPLPATN
jgi:small subunit ribosomal protein S5